ncbi:dipeptidyl-peptidase 3 family protein [Paremcibacter congregatus]|uniref:Zn-dependent hydrolase n=1 Tax=Paremcibacter congregatus TaxID=2043170 RepID=A0A2G4YNN5_9PROT|nr:Zn-dependent hydrolase [Paremcibacter congregatus]PHZ83917.1 Zn-dependent hydrolase [Paremcibacter congregatus]QDE27474.1 Zn-dependent hydrolase [Paremcibacter congregatus]
MTLKLKTLLTAVSATALMALSGCGDSGTDKPVATSENPWISEAAEKRADIYTDFTLTSDLSHLSDNQRQMVSLLIDAAKIMDELFWQQTYGDKEALLNSISDPKAKAFVLKNYGPWDRLDGDKPFLKGVGEKPLGANFYPADITKEEFEAFDHPDKVGLYSVLRRDEAGKLTVVPYHVIYKAQLTKAADILRQAATLADNPEFKNYLMLRADAIETDNYQPSDFAWMDMKTNPVELVIGAIETYEDMLYGYRAAYETYILIKDPVWSEKLAKFTAVLPELQKGLPVSDAYKAETPGTDSDLNAYDAVYYSGLTNAGSKTIAINLPNDEEVQLKKGTRRLQLKNAMRAKFDKILLPISEQLIAPEQRKHVTFNAFFSNTMFHEVSHGLGIKQTLTGKGPVRLALKDAASSYEEGKADLLGLYMIKKLYEKGEITEGVMMDYYVTFVASIFRSSRFGASSAHGKANMIRFNYFLEKGAFAKNADGYYVVDQEKFVEAMNSLGNILLTIQGDGDYDRAMELLHTKGIMSPTLKADLGRLKAADIPVDVNFIQGKEVLGLK